MTFEYDKSKFSIEQQSYIDKTIEICDDERVLRAMTNCDVGGNPIFSYSHMSKIFKAVKDDLTGDQILLCTGTRASLDGCKPIFTPILTAEQMGIIYNKMKRGLKNEDVHLVMTLNTLLKPVFDSSQMNLIADEILERKIGSDKIKILAATKNEIPVFDISQMISVRYFLRDAKDEQVKEFEKSIKEKVPSVVLTDIARANLSHDTIRVYRALHKLEINESNMKKMLAAKLTYEDLKEVKYLTNCAKAVCLPMNPVLRMTPKDDFTVSKIRENLLSHIYNARLYEMECTFIVDKCLKLGLPPEQINYLTNPEFMLDYHDMKDIAIGLLNGLTPEEIENVTGSNQGYRTLAQAIDDAVRDKYFDLDNLEEKIEIKTDWFEEVAKDEI